MVKDKENKLQLIPKIERYTEPTIVLNEEVITTTAILQLIATTTILITAMATMVRVSHSNTFFGLYILRNIYSKSISIKEIYSFLI